MGLRSREVGCALAIRRIMTNLTDNALKFGQDVELTVQTTPDAAIEICVLDRGPGTLNMLRQAMNCRLQSFGRSTRLARTNAIASIRQVNG
jgi:K+-sensing histidine kinase KdpD